MNRAGAVFGMLVLLVSVGYMSTASGQEAAQQPNVGLTLTETLNRLSPPASTRDDLREIPPPRNDTPRNVRVTVTLGDQKCLPGEDGWVGPLPPSRRPVRTR